MKWKPIETYRAFVFILDGVGDRPVPELNFRTPLEVARKPNIDYIARMGMTGLADMIEPGIRPGTDTGHLAIFGYEPYKYYPGRGPLEAIGAGAKLKPGDVALRCNLATVEERNGKLIVVDRRAGRIKGKDAEELVRALNEAIKEIDGVKVEFHPATAHRVALVLRGKGLSPKISNSDPGTAKEGNPVREVVPLEDSEEARRTAEILNKIIKLSYDVLKDHPVNKRRVKEGKLPANIILTRGAGMVPLDLKSFKERFGVKGYVIAEEDTIIGLAKLLGMEAEIPEGATGDLESDVIAIGKRALEVYETTDTDIIFVHIKGPDIAGHDADYLGKIQIIEKADEMIGYILRNTDENKTVYAITADHSTPCIVRDHSGDPVPIAVKGPKCRIDKVQRYDEVSCAEGMLGKIRMVNLVPIILDLMNKRLKFGE
ncbi:MAG: 2,3-bisphosphoglycerate-independent phosphoglycerate mutase [Thermococcus sp.]|uniref:2,3-bisphosphoglycerate-independent phosphoglycerate mutase n=1 Tax=Thermococcus sp. TaxID=35749 RepID=UPI001DDEF9F0|nr:2,3-bisphosphoglycerate-independent phosphoglycerate mutase [Thermococcus sp.]MBO8173816.1 2,3-bisphosphoglycerate-independent phosphoglycerate mutase [Thermococcus sp.]